VVLLDATVLSNFSHIERVDLLRLALPDDVATTPQVMAEVERGIAAGKLPSNDWDWLGVVQLTPAEEANLNQVRLVLGDGEASCIAVALKREDVVIFTDDLDARRYAKRRNLRISGTLGILSLLVVKKHLTVDQADAYLGQMIAHNYRSPVTSIANLVDEAASDQA
jgi:predicted nucleic acid-binding protein